MQLSRRALFLSSTASIVAVTALTACSTTAPLTISQAIADALGIATSLKTDAAAIATLFPNILTLNGAANVVPVSDLTNAAGTGWLDIAIKLLIGLVSTTPVAITNLASAEQDINLVLNVVAAIAGVVAATVPGSLAIVAVVEAAISLAPAIEALVTQLLKAPVTKSVHKLNFKPVPASVLATRVPLMSSDKARVVLGVKTVG